MRDKQQVCFIVRMRWYIWEKER